MAKASTTAKKKSGPKTDNEETEPLSTFQTPKTGRKELLVEKSQKKTVEKTIITIEKVKVEKDDALTINFSKVSNGSSSHHSDSFDQRMHPDLNKKFGEFRIHLALLCDYVSTQQLKSLEKYNKELVEKFHVSSISIKPDEGVVITGHKITKLKKAVILNTPFTLFNQDEKTAYSYQKELSDLVEDFIKEVLEYLDGSKKGEDPQQSFDFDKKKKEEESLVEEAV
jgi:hypothetical protein